MSIGVRELTSKDEALLLEAPEGVFDHPVDATASRAFLADASHRLVGAIDDGRLVGFASAVLTLHPDKPKPECFVNEVSVAASHRDRGIGKQLLNEMLTVARSAGASEAWVLAEHVDRVARRLYASVGGVEGKDAPVMFSFRL